ncbi:MAG: hypothetical protein CYG59_01310 [Chloroflexi bacterium]|nr:MAG: hypothetical protein CYG59_01310 [Chloroflexota bacterium]
MSRSEQPVQTMVTRTLRAAIKVGDDYYTVEETISLPPTASDEQIAQAVTTGLRMYEAQRSAVEGQLRVLREQVVAQPLPVQIREPDAPASEKQRAYMDYLLKELNWDHERLSSFASDRMLNLLTLTKREASELIDELKQIATGTAAVTGESEDADAGALPVPAAVAAPVAIDRQAILPLGEQATQRQVRALERLIEERGIDVEGELRARYGGRPIAELSMDEAGQLLSEWQQRPRQLRPATTRRAA